MNNVIDMTNDFQAKKIIADVERFLRANDELHKYDVGVEWYAGENYTIMLKDVNSETYTMLDPEMLGIEI